MSSAGNIGNIPAVVIEDSTIEHTSLNIEQGEIICSSCDAILESNQTIPEFFSDIHFQRTTDINVI